LRIILVALNARYVHTNLAVRSLREVLREQDGQNWNVSIREFSINEQLEKVAGEIYEEKPDMLGFSCYIWNLSRVLALIRMLRPVLPEVFFFAGGPEVSYNARVLLSEYPELDAVVLGEGEYSVPDLVKARACGDLPWEVSGVCWRLRPESLIKSEQENNRIEDPVLPGFKGEYFPAGADWIIINESTGQLPDLNLLPNPYAQEEDFRGRLVYVETSRGCPFNCAFCISSTFRGMRFLEPERFRLILRKLFQYGAGTIKFVDRTFNANKNHAFAILQVFREEAEKHIRNKEDDSLFSPRAHCEMTGELLDQEWLDFLEEYPPGMIQLEIGVQSTYQPALRAVNRRQEFSSWKDKAFFLQHSCNIPVHLDLIAGLPYENWAQFGRSFDEVYEVRPNCLQLGFLKVLKGSEIHEKSREYGLIYSPDPPYSILRTGSISHGEILVLKKIEELLEKYYNSGKFKFSLEYIMDCWESPFRFYHSFAEYWQEQGWFRREWSSKSLFFNLWQYLKHAAFQDKTSAGINDPEYASQVWQEALRFDYYLAERAGYLPEFLQPDYSIRGKPAFALSALEKLKTADEIRQDPIWLELIPSRKQMDRRQWTRATALDYFIYDIPVRERKNASVAKGRLSRDIRGNGRGSWYLFYYPGREVRYYKYNKPES